MAMKATHPEDKQPKAKYRVYNWAEYNAFLAHRGAPTFWMDEHAIRHWHHTQPSGKRGRTYRYSDLAITTALMIQAVFNLSLRQTEGFINALFQLMGLDLTSPDYSSISKRAKTLNVDIRRPKGPVAHLVFDATGLKVYGEGEWKMRKHGKEKRRTWRKLHLGVDGQSHHLICAEVSLEKVGDSEVLGPMLRPLRRQIGTVYGDGAYDSRQCYEEIAKKVEKGHPSSVSHNFSELGGDRTFTVAAAGRALQASSALRRAV